jgi:hypothetical protein
MKGPHPWPVRETGEVIALMRREHEWHKADAPCAGCRELRLLDRRIEAEEGGLKEPRVIVTDLELSWLRSVCDAADRVVTLPEHREATTEEERREIWTAQLKALLLTGRAIGALAERTV